MEWIDGNIGSKVTMKYPAVYLMGEHAKGETLSIAFAGEGQHQDAGAKMVHAAPHTLDDHLQVGRPRRRTHVLPRARPGPEGAHHSPARASATRCSSTRSAAPTPTRTSTSARTTCRWATRPPCRRCREDQLFYLMSRGMNEDEAMAMIVRGFVEPIAASCRWSTPSS
jgi:Fe-S cluster assembly protein SufB